MVNENYDGLPLKCWYKKFDFRSDLSSGLVHLTKPYSEDLKSIISTFNSFDEQAIVEINKKSVDRLIDILNDEEIIGSTTQSGFIMGDKRAACFQDGSIRSIKENVNFELRRLNLNNLNTIRYCGVGLSFNKMYTYSQGGRPVIYEQKDVAKKLLNYNKEEFWRIVNLELEKVEPYVENLFEGKEEDTKSYPMYTKINDWTHEREWRVPNKFSFNIEDLFNEFDSFSIILNDKLTYEYFLHEIDRRWNLMDQIGEYSNSGIFNFNLKGIVPNKPNSKIVVLEDI